MSQKRARDAERGADGHERVHKKQKKGFTVGPANLPDGTYKRKNKKIKDALIQRAQIKKNYAKVKAKADKEEAPVVRRTHAAGPAGGVTQDEPLHAEDDAPEPTTLPHPDRQTLIDKPQPDHPPQEKADMLRQRKRRPKAVPFKREYEQAQQRKAEAEERRTAREEADRQRKEKLEERERFRRTMAKARTGSKNGQRKLGRESTVLLEKVKRMVKDGG